MLTFVKINFLNPKIMKKIMKSFMAMALGLSLVLAGCSKDDGPDPFEGNYEAEATITGPEQMVPGGSLSIPSITLNLAKESADYKASATLSTFGSLSLLLTSVTETANAGGVVSYDFVVAEQTLTITGLGNVPVSGSGTLGSVTIASETSYTIELNLIVTGTGVNVAITGSK